MAREDRLAATALSTFFGSNLPRRCGVSGRVCSTVKPATTREMQGRPECQRGRLAGTFARFDVSRSRAVSGTCAFQQHPVVSDCGRRTEKSVRVSCGDMTASFVLSSFAANIRASQDELTELNRIMDEKASSVGVVLDPIDSMVDFF